MTNKEIESQKACTMEMSMNNGDISMTMMIEHEQAKREPQEVPICQGHTLK